MPAVAAEGYRYFVAPAPDDAWSSKIARWQRRELAPLGDERLPGSVSGAGRAQARPPAPGLDQKFREFRRQQQRIAARELADWIQTQSREHYVPDGAVDSWATLEETLERNGDDCDGLELLVFHLLRELGFAREEIYRAIVHRPSDGQHHMVTLWFEQRDDPWVIDPTGAMTEGMPRMSELPGWVPLKVFSETQEFTVHAP